MGGAIAQDRRREIGAYLLAFPSLAIFLGLFVGPLFYFFLVSFWSFRSYRLVREFTIQNYATVAGQYIGLLGYTLAIAATVSFLAVTLGFTYAFIIRFKAGRLGPPLLFFALITLFGGYLMKIYAWRTILGREGMINEGLLSLGLIGEPLSWLLYNPPAAVLTLVHFLFPFAVLPVFASMRGIRDVEIEAARDLGAGGFRILIDQIIPRCRTGLTTGFVLTFLLACGDWVTPIMVGGRMTMFGNLIASQFGEFLNWPLGAAMTFVLLVAAGLCIALFHRLLGLVGSAP
jgi:spermidine/putrescine transport system permease protein